MAAAAACRPDRGAAASATRRNDGRGGCVEHVVRRQDLPSSGGGIHSRRVPAVHHRLTADRTERRIDMGLLVKCQQYNPKPSVSLSEQDLHIVHKLSFVLAIIYDRAVYMLLYMYTANSY